MLREWWAQWWAHLIRSCGPGVGKLRWPDEYENGAADHADIDRLRGEGFVATAPISDGYGACDGRAPLPPRLRAVVEQAPLEGEADGASLHESVLEPARVRVALLESSWWTDDEIAP